MDYTVQLDTMQLNLLDFAIQKNLFIGIAESGKSQSVGVIVEWLIERGIPVVIFDPVGIWRNLKVSNGSPTGKAYPVVIVGTGGDFPINTNSNEIEQITRFVLKLGVSVVFDISDLDREKWGDVVATSLHVLFQENGLYGIRHIVFDEAAEFAPQSTKMIRSIYEEIERMGRIGGNRKLGMTFINNRPEQLAKSLTGLCEGLFLHRQKDEIAIKKLNKWLGSVSMDNRQEIIKSLSTLKAGQCWVWSRESSSPTLVQMPRKNSYHPNRRDFGIGNINVVTMDDLPNIVSEIKAGMSTEQNDIPVWTPPAPPSIVEFLAKPQVIIEIDFDSLSIEDKKIVQEAVNTKHGSSNVKKFVDGIIVQGFIYCKQLGNDVCVMQSNDNIHSMPLRGKVQCEYATLAVHHVKII